MRIRARAKILDYVSRSPGASAAQIASGLGMSPPAVRHHLAILRADGRIENAPSPRQAGRGRPRLAYRLSPAVAGHNLGMLAEHLLVLSAEKRPGRAGAASLLAALSEKMSDELRPARPESLPTRRLAALVARLNELHYASRWEAGAEGPRVIFGRCPYSAIIERHPELCRMDSEAIAAIMRANVQQTAKIAPLDAASTCVLALKYP